MIVPSGGEAIDNDAFRARGDIAMKTGVGIATALAALLSTIGVNGQDPAPEQLEVAGIENVYRLSPRLYSGGDARGAEALGALKALGIKTLISVDGAAPDVETARALGLRYVHLPIGYDSVPREQAIRLVQALRTLPGPVYVHCHHGKHRGPAAAAICGMATEGWTHEHALDWMKRAGTSPDYRGLYASALEFRIPTEEELRAIGVDALPERAPIPPLVEVMIQVDERWDHLKAAQKTGFDVPPDQPDIDPPHEALQLVELFRELARRPETADRGPEFVAAVNAAERGAKDLEDVLQVLKTGPSPETRQRADAVFQTASKMCTTCHARFRDVKDKGDAR